MDWRFPLSACFSPGSPVEFRPPPLFRFCSTLCSLEVVRWSALFFDDDALTESKQCIVCERRCLPFGSRTLARLDITPLCSQARPQSLVPRSADRFCVAFLRFRSIARKVYTVRCPFGATVSCDISHPQSSDVWLDFLLICCAQQTTTFVRVVDRESASDD